ncbi:hypothetical protein [Devosia sp. DBB001]|nr:hypothetical protein [Devosia sp. DBB001]
MKQIDLEPDQYAAKDAKGHWRRKSNPKRSGIFCGIAVLALAYIGWNAPEISPYTLFGGTALMAFAAGALAADWLRDLY